MCNFPSVDSRSSDSTVQCGFKILSHWTSWETAADVKSLQGGAGFQPASLAANIHVQGRVAHQSWHLLPQLGTVTLASCLQAARAKGRGREQRAVQRDGTRMLRVAARSGPTSSLTSWKVDGRVGWVTGKLELPSKSYLPTGSRTRGGGGGGGFLERQCCSRMASPRKEC